MKVRHGFVSNSSSSSFLCDLCKHHEAGYDGDYGDFSYVVCENDHHICEGHKLDACAKKSVEEMLAILKGDIDNEEYTELEGASEEEIRSVYEEFLEEENWGREISAEQCPLCQLEAVEDRMLIDFLFMKMNTTREEYVKTLKSQFGTLENLEKFIKEGK